MSETQRAAMKPGTTLLEKLEAKRDHAEREAWHALRYHKFLMFGYWAAVWVHYNGVLPRKRNPFSCLKPVAAEKLAELEARP